jgi:hypothetical protein
MDRISRRMGGKLVPNKSGRADGVDLGFPSPP